MRFAFIKAEKAHHGVAIMCRVFGVARSGYYAWAARSPSKRKHDDVRLRVEIRAAFRENRRAYGSPRLYREVRKVVPGLGRRRTARLMREEGLIARRTPRPYRRAQEQLVRGIRNVLNREFEQEAPNTVWAGDITYIATSRGWAYLAVILDLFSRRVVGWAISHGASTGVALRALENAIVARQPKPGVVAHTDQGAQYTSDAYLRELRDNGFTPSLSRRGNCWDNACVESFFSTLKLEWTNRQRYQGLDDLRASLVDYLGFYNRKRLHSTLGYVSPVEFEESARC